MMKRGAGEVRRIREDKSERDDKKKKKKKKRVEAKEKKNKNIKKGKNRKGKKNNGENNKGELKKGKKKKKGKKRNGRKIKRKKTGKKGKKRNKDKIKRKRNKLRRRKPKKRKQEGRQTTTAACSNLTCLTALVSVLKFEKDTVRNFLAQEKRTNSKLQLMKNKQNRSDKYMGTAKFLEKRLGETSAHKSDGPLCKGSYNTSEGIKVKIIQIIFFLD